MTTEKRQRNGVPGAVQRPRAEALFPPPTVSRLRTRFITVDHVIFEVNNPSILPSVYMTKAVHAAHKHLSPLSPDPSDDPASPSPLIALRENPHPLPDQVPAEVLELVLKYCYFHTSKKRAKMKGQSVRDWDESYVRDGDPRRLCELASAAYYLEIPHLVELTCRAIASIISGKDPEQIRETFQIENDFLQRLLPQGHNAPSGRRGISSARATQRKHTAPPQPFTSNSKKHPSFSLDDIGGLENQDSDNNSETPKMSQLSVAEAVQWIEGSDSSKKTSRKRKKKRNKNKPSAEPTCIHPSNHPDTQMTSPSSSTPEPPTYPNGHPSSLTNGHFHATDARHKAAKGNATTYRQVVNLITSSPEVVNLVSSDEEAGIAPGSTVAPFKSLLRTACQEQQCVVPAQGKEPAQRQDTDGIKQSPSQNRPVKRSSQRPQVLQESSDESSVPDDRPLSVPFCFHGNNDNAEPSQFPIPYVKTERLYPDNIHVDIAADVETSRSRAPQRPRSIIEEKRTKAETSDAMVSMQVKKNLTPAGEQSEGVMSADAQVAHENSQTREDPSDDSIPGDVLVGARERRGDRRAEKSGVGASSKDIRIDLASSGVSSRSEGMVQLAKNIDSGRSAHVEHTNVRARPENNPLGNKQNPVARTEERWIHGRTASKSTSGAAVASKNEKGIVPSIDAALPNVPVCTEPERANPSFIHCPEQMNREVEAFEKRLTGDAPNSLERPLIENGKVLRCTANSPPVDQPSCRPEGEVPNSYGESGDHNISYWQKKIEVAKLHEREKYLKQFSEAIEQHTQSLNSQRKEIRDSLAQVRHELSQMGEGKSSLDQRVERAILSERETNLMQFAGSVLKQINGLNGQKEEVLDRLALAQMQLTGLNNK